MTTVKRRTYRSPRRRGQAEETRRRILASARRLFVENGYGATTIEAIARDADVAPQTVYAGFASKRGLLFALLDQMAADADVAGLTARLEQAADDPRRQLEARIAFTARFYAGGIDLIDIARTVSGVEPDLGAMWAEGEGRRHTALSAVVAAWHEAGVLRPDMTAREATDLLWALIGPDMFRLLAIEQGWGRERFERWIVETAERALFAGGAGG